MQHERFKELLTLALADELKIDEERELEQHLETCDACRRELAELRRMKLAVDTSISDPSDRMLRDARRELFEEIRRDERKVDLPVRSRSAIHDGRAREQKPTWRGWLEPFRWALPAATTLAAGVFIGYVAFGRTAPQGVTPAEPALTSTDHELGPAEVSNVRFVDVDSQSGEIELRYDLVRPVRLRANVDDERMQRMLAYALLNDENDGVRLQAISAFDHVPSSSEDNDVKRALIEAMTTDPNPGVRKQSLTVLLKFPFDDDVKNACLQVLANDTNPGMRVAAIDMLAQAAKKGTVDRAELYDLLKRDYKDEAYLMQTTGAIIEEEDNVR